MQCHRETAVAHFCSRRRRTLQLCVRLNMMRVESRYTDLQLTAHGAVMPVHRNVLAASSPYFNTMFTCSFVESSSSNVDLSHVFPTSDMLRDFLDYIYTGRITLNEANFRQILDIASHFLLDELRDSCAHFMFVNLTPHNVLKVWMLSEKYSLNALAGLCRDLIRARFQDVIVPRDDFVHLPVKCLSEIILNGGMDFAGISERLRCLLKWFSADLGERQQGMQWLLQDPVIQEKLGLLDGDIPETVSLNRELDLIECLESLISDPRYTLPPLEEENEALVGWSYRPSNIENSWILRLCAYLPEHNIWYNITKLRVSSFFGNVLGFLGQHVLFKSAGGFVIVNLNNNTFERVSLPSPRRGRSSVRSHAIFVFEHRVFCIMEISRHVKRSLSNGTTFMYREVHSFLKVYNFDRDTWQMVCNLPVPKQMTWLPLQFHVVPREDTGCCYVLAMSSTCNFQIRGRGDQWRINGPYLLAIKRRRTQYSAFRLTDPPIDREMMIINRTYNAPRFAGCGGKLYMYGVSVDETACTEQFTGVLQYDMDRDEWTERPDRTVTFPPRRDANVTGLESANFHLDSVSVGGVQSFRHGRVYRLTVPCPYVSHFNSANIETGQVHELTPPPCESLCEFSVCRVPRELLENAPTSYSQHLENCKSRMVKGRLAGAPYRLWGCTFEPLTGSAPERPVRQRFDSSSSDDDT